MHDVEINEINLEQALFQHEKGEISFDQVQRITNNTLNAKYKAELGT
jgi:hypothetical protein